MPRAVNFPPTFNQMELEDKKYLPLKSIFSCPEDLSLFAAHLINLGGSWKIINYRLHENTAQSLTNHMSF